MTALGGSLHSSVSTQNMLDGNKHCMEHFRELLFHMIEKSRKIPVNSLDALGTRQKKPLEGMRLQKTAAPIYIEHSDAGTYKDFTTT